MEHEFSIGDKVIVLDTPDTVCFRNDYIGKSGSIIALSNSGKSVYVSGECGGKSFASRDVCLLPSCKLKRLRLLSSIRKKVR